VVCLWKFPEKDTIRLFGLRLAYPLQKIFFQLPERLTQSICYILEEQRRQKPAELHNAVELKNEPEEKRQMKNKKDSLLQQLWEEKAKLKQKHEQATAKELIDEASTKMRAAIEQKNMQSVQVAQMILKAGNEKLQETSKKLDLIWANKKVSENDLTTVITKINIW